MIDKVLFLDIDGVLNCRDCLTHRDSIGASHVEILNKVLVLTGAEVVISSTWRIINTIPQIQKFLDMAGFGYSILSTTPTNGKGRGDEIWEWLSEHPARKFAIVDDDSDMGHLMPFLVKTKFDTGLTDKEAEELIEMLGEKK